jgi:MFS family permease
MTTCRPFVVLEAATVLSGTAAGITMVAFPWLVLQTTGDATAAATIAAASAIPLLLSMVVAGSIVDRVGRRRVAAASDVASMSAVALIPLLGARVGLSFGLLLVVAALSAMFDPAGLTARQSMLPEAAAGAGLGLERANGIHESAYGFAFLLGPGIGGLLIGLVGATTTFWATAVAFGLSAVLMALTPIPGGGRPTRSDTAIGLVSSTREGLAFLWNDRVLRAVALVFMLVVAVWLPVEGVILPVHFTEVSDPTQLGLLITAMSTGGVVGALLYAAVGSRVSRRTAFVSSLIGCAFPVVGLALLPAYPVMLVLGLLTGLFFGAVNPISNLVMQIRTPEVMRGRVIGVMGSAAYAAGPLGYLVAGPLIDRYGVQHVFLCLALVLLAVSLGAAFLPSLRGLDDAPVPGSVIDVSLDVHDLDPDYRTVEAERIADLLIADRG